jgi:hypothetical protein
MTKVGQSLIMSKEKLSDTLPATRLALGCNSPQEAASLGCGQHFFEYVKMFARATTNIRASAFFRKDSR